MTLVARIAIADPDLSLRAIAAQLETMRERTPRGGWQWAASSVEHLLDHARRLGLTVHEPADG
ncbi:recombinase family protein [Bradyrhizobium sp. 147]|nr:recombinase family protein [Bradyrhizobium sp. 164]MCK1666385.1 recombinase family protein [Bradyrhizobium sp. 153]MCK1679253.1 recombinase family protein [Bradyrhizobium sp. 147]